MRLFPFIFIPLDILTLYSLHSHHDSSHSHRLPHPISRFPILAFTDSLDLINFCELNSLILYAHFS